MPDQVADATNGEKGDAHQREFVAAGHSFAPGQAARVVDVERANEQNGVDEVTRVEDGVPGSEKGVIYFAVGVCPAINVEAYDKDEAGDAYK
ncbi:MAG: hypothetical protein NVSMB27_01280 [Ktedonobacteraceae bacterium]